MNNAVQQNTAKASHIFWGRLVKEAAYQSRMKKSASFCDRQIKKDQEREKKMRGRPIGARRVYVRFKGKEIYFTEREAETIQQVLQGLTLRQVAKNFGLSHRTVEYYFNGVKKKLGFRKKKELFDRIKKTNFSDQFKEDETCC